MEAQPLEPLGAAPAAAIDLDDGFADCFFGRAGDADLLDDIAAAALHRARS